ncbi:uncharacterized protein LOC111378138 [Olea europaea var. sylvestris]|uniref:uncharacterized protein LOC111378138 n=1 Tax=Olea europaea var. sylvestris TaxID=158386 RepID=UPI000C1CEF34|nr:uncharacterized protein LOC111378138 [Olea europaea var. sylvestris]
MPLEDIVKSLATNTLQFQQETMASIKSLENQMGQMATSINKLEAQGSGKLPSYTMVNPRKNVSVILFRSGKEVEIPRATPILLEQENEKDVLEEKSVPNDNDVPKRKFPPLSDYKPVPPFPQVLVGYRKDERDHELMILCVNMRFEKINVGENVYAFIQRKLPTKCKDPGMFNILCTIGTTRFEKAMLDSGASINVMPYSVYASLKLGPLNEIGVVIQLADKSNAYSKGVVEDVLVKINDLVFPADFYVLDMGYSNQTIPILLGRQFLRTFKAKIDFYSCVLTMEFDDKISEFNIYEP